MPTNKEFYAALKKKENKEGMTSARWQNMNP